MPRGVRNSLRGMDADVPGDVDLASFGQYGGAQGSPAKEASTKAMDMSQMRLRTGGPGAGGGAGGDRDRGSGSRDGQGGGGGGQENMVLPAVALPKEAKPQVLHAAFPTGSQRAV